MSKPIDNAINKFLCWKLPEDFFPDCYITFKHPGGNASWPIGTNLLTAEQARAMFEHCLAGAAEREDAQTEALIVKLRNTDELVFQPGLINLLIKLCEQAADALAADAQWEQVARAQDAKLRAMVDEPGGIEKLREVLAKAEAQQVAGHEPTTEKLYRVVCKSNFDNPLVNDAWASEPLCQGEAIVKAGELNYTRCDISYFYTVRPETYTLYKFEP